MSEVGNKGQVPCCGGPVSRSSDDSATFQSAGLFPDWVADTVTTPVGTVPIVKTEWSREDRRGRRLARWTRKRMSYTVPPGLYAVGSPDNAAPVLVSANYKLSFDVLRRELTGWNAWILVLDTRGINVWCAAGKGTFSTEEIIRRIRTSRLQEFVSHRTIIVPQLGAPGVAAHEVRKETGFRVLYGPVRAKDILAFLNGDFTCSPEMRRVTFSLNERLALVPMEFIGTLLFTWIPLLIFLLLDLFSPGFFRNLFLKDVLLTMGAVLAGTVLTPAFLPWLPGRSFALKGWEVGVVVTGGLGLCFSLPVLLQISDLLLFPAAAAYLGLNFTGATPFTSLSGVVKEMSAAIPLIILSILAALVLRIIFLIG